MITEKRKKYMKDYREKNRQHVLATQRKYYKKFWSKYYLENKSKVLSRVRKWRKTENGKKYVVESEKKYVKNNLNKVYARRKLREAVRSGKVVRKPCIVCKKEKTDAHHTDYSKPLKVVWLCRTHHLEEHSKIKSFPANYH